MNSIPWFATLFPYVAPWESDASHLSMMGPWGAIDGCALIEPSVSVLAKIFARTKLVLVLANISCCLVLSHGDSSRIPMDYPINFECC